MRYRALKFGGTSVGSPEMIRRVVEIVQSCPAELQPVTVVSAFKGVTNGLIAAAEAAVAEKSNFLDHYQALEDQHLSVVTELIPAKQRARVLAITQGTLSELLDVLQALSKLRELSAKSLDRIMSFGERLSAYIIAETVNHSPGNLIGRYLDARDFIRTDSNFGNATVQVEETYRNLKSKVDEVCQDVKPSFRVLPIITGFIAEDGNGATTTLGRGGSDYTGALVAAALDAEKLEIWTDVDGVLTADPRKVKKVFTIPQISYEEALELSHFGAKVVYGPTMRPVLAKGISIRICNTFNPDAAGTIIGREPSPPQFPVTGLSSIDSVTLLRVQGSGLMGVAGVASRVFGALGRERINVLLITQASSEHTICCAVLPHESSKALAALEAEFRLEQDAGMVDPIIVEPQLSVISIVGANMCRSPGIAAKFFTALGRNGVNIVAIAQGSSELNISAVIDKSYEAKALAAVHDEFFQISTTQSLNLFVVGTGLIGGTLLKQLDAHTPKLREHYHLELNLLGVANSKKVLLDREGISFRNALELLDSQGEESELSEFVDSVVALNVANSVFVDCTANESITDSYQGILAAHISIVTPNKKAHSGAMEKYQAIMQTAAQSGVRFLYETSVGAGLPVISTLSDLLRSGDQVLKIEAVLSGTLSYIFNHMSETRPFSAVVRTAKELGFTEPDPRDDLAGIDVARKLLILAREAGYSIEMGDISVESLVPTDCRSASSGEDFLKMLASHDAAREIERARTVKQGKRLCYIATFNAENRDATVRLEAIDAVHPFFALSGSDNIIAFTTLRYRECPLVIKGPGAGAEVTAAGVLSDIVRIGQVIRQK
jgi:bifunctional aspartokinase / homoserine dehydrogenase 1